jgi:hypothetical protein
MPAHAFADRGHDLLDDRFFGAAGFSFGDWA